MGIFTTTLVSPSCNPTRRWTLAVILILWALVNGILLWQQGIVTTGEAHKYVRIAHYYLDNGHLTAPNFQYYSIIIFLAAFFIKLHLGLFPVVVVQMLVNLAATLYFFQTIHKLFRSERTALAVTLLLLLNIPYQSFNTAIQSESLFQSLSLLVSCYLLQRPHFLVRHLLYILIFIAILSLSRPLGIVYAPAAFTYFYITSLRHAGMIPRIAFLGTLALAFLYVLNHAMGSGGEYNFMLPFQEEHIICGSPTLLHPLNFPVAGNGNSVYALLYYIFHHPGQFLRLAFWKTISFWGIYRPYFSMLHNLLLLLFFYPIFIMADLSLKTWFHWHLNRLVYILVLILTTWVTVILTCDDWSNRIFLSISPYLILLSAGFLKSFFPSTER